MCKEEFEKFRDGITPRIVEEQGYIPQVIEANETIIFCPNCGVTAIMGTKRDDAIEMWNSRPTDSTPEEEKDAES